MWIAYLQWYKKFIHIKSGLTIKIILFTSIFVVTINFIKIISLLYERKDFKITFRKNIKFNIQKIIIDIDFKKGEIYRK